MFLASITSVQPFYLVKSSIWKIDVLLLSTAPLLIDVSINCIKKNFFCFCEVRTSRNCQIYVFGRMVWLYMMCFCCCFFILENWCFWCLCVVLIFVYDITPRFPFTLIVCTWPFLSFIDFFIGVCNILLSFLIDFSFIDFSPLQLFTNTSYLFRMTMILCLDIIYVV